MREIEHIYESTTQQFTKWAKSENQRLRNVACAETLRACQNDWGAGSAEIGDEIGFSILWTPPLMEAEILLCGACVTDFKDKNENKVNLSGVIPNRNTCINAKHKFGKTIEKTFQEFGRYDLFENCVGMNVWHFQYVGMAKRGNFPIESVEFCEANTKKIIEALKPKRIVALGGEAYTVLKKQFSKVHKFTHPSHQHGKKFSNDLHEFLEQEF